MDNPSTSPEQRTLTLVVKSPNQTHPDQIIKDIDINWTVKDLKNHLFQVYPNNPPEKDQRIIYSGKLLLDHLPIRDAFRRSDPMPTIHLVCTFRVPPKGQLQAQSKVTPAEQRRGGDLPLVTGENSDAPATPLSPPSGPQAEGLRHRGHPANPTPPWTSAAAPASAPMTHPTFPTYSLYSPQQLLWLQQMYARQYYMHYQAAMAAAASAPATPAPAAAPHPAALPNPAPIDNLPANRNVADAPFINPGGANQNMRMNAQGGPVMEDEEDGNRDWLDWAYTAAQFSVFLSIVYFYSTISRFILVMSSLIFMYLHTAGWFPFQQRPVAPVPNQQAPEVIQNQQNQNRNPEPADAPIGRADANADEGGAEGGAEREEAGRGGAAPLTAVLVPPHRVSLAWTAWVFFKAFFASLIPEIPRGVAN